MFPFLYFHSATRSNWFLFSSTRRNEAHKYKDSNPDQWFWRPLFYRWTILTCCRFTPYDFCLPVAYVWLVGLFMTLNSPIWSNEKVATFRVHWPAFLSCKKSVRLSATHFPSKLTALDAGKGLEPLTSGIWALRATDCYHPAKFDSLPISRLQFGLLRISPCVDNSYPLSRAFTFYYHGIHVLKGIIS